MKKTLRKHLTNPFDNETLKKIFFSILPAEQSLVTVIFNEVHLKSGLRYNSGHICGTSENKEEKLATSVIVFEMISLHGGPRIVLSVHLVSFLNAEELESSFCWCVNRRLWR